MIEDAIWTIKTFQRDQGKWFSVESDVLYVDFMEAWSWTIRNIKYMGDEIAGEYGAHGSVVCVKNREGIGSKDYYYIGTSHGFETVQNFSILVDGKERETKLGATFSGRAVVVRKESNLGPLDHRMEITFPASGDYIIETHTYKVVEDLSERFNFLLAFMHENNPALDQWLAVLADEKELAGSLPNRGNGGIFLDRDIKTVIFYSRTMDKGVTFTYPEIYMGADQGPFKNSAPSNSIVDRKYDNKLYFQPEVRKMGYKVGDVFEYRIKVIPFSVEAAGWKDKGKALAIGEEF